MAEQPNGKRHKMNMQSNIFQEFTSRNIQVAEELKEPMCSSVAFYIRQFVLNSQHVFRHLPSMLQLMSFGKVVFPCVCWKYKYQCWSIHSHSHIYIYFSFTAGVEFCRLLKLNSLDFGLMWCGGKSVKIKCVWIGIGIWWGGCMANWNEVVVKKKRKFISGQTIHSVNKNSTGKESEDETDFRGIMRE